METVELVTLGSSTSGSDRKVFSKYHWVQRSLDGDLAAADTVAGQHWSPWVHPCGGIRKSLKSEVPKQRLAELWWMDLIRGILLQQCRTTVAPPTGTPDSCPFTSLLWKPVAAGITSLAARSVLEDLHPSAPDQDGTGVEYELEQIKQEMESASEANLTSLWKCIQNPVVRKQMICGFCLQWLLQSTGILVIFNYQVRSLFQAQFSIA
ncbi:hypothetical protein N7449_011875 [Penicillium cf. viridicatum]|uniref:Uncharacterized protein n=1 Tax=Penicillium cf. viridicatum TaxID=2972119 RepID=A0A9W9IP95_9EURO|nr:hypothetical protein N7449_011875 [Penicillium cf. viridicatum]